MDDNQINEMINNSIIPDSYWLSQGHNQIYTNAMRAQQLSMLMASVQLLLLRSRSKDNEISISNDITICGMVNNINMLPENILLHDDSLLPVWQQLGEAAASFSDHQIEDRKLSISIANIEVPSNVMKILTAAFEKISLQTLHFENNRICTTYLVYSIKSLFGEWGLCKYEQHDLVFQSNSVCKMHQSRSNRWALYTLCKRWWEEE